MQKWDGPWQNDCLCHKCQPCSSHHRYGLPDTKEQCPQCQFLRSETIKWLKNYCETVFYPISIDRAHDASLLAVPFNIQDWNSPLSIPFSSINSKSTNILWVCVGVRSCCMRWIKKICAFEECVSAQGLCGLGTLSIHVLALRACVG